MHRIELRNLTVGYFNNDSQRYMELIEPISCRVTAGKKCVLVGPNGAGKTSLLRLIAGDAAGAQVVKGHISYSIEGTELTRSPSAKGYAVFAGLASVDYISEHLDFLTVRTILASGKTPSYYYAGTIETPINKSIELIAPKLSLENYLDAHFSELSSGQRMMVVIGRALIARPQLLVLDEIDQYLAPKAVTQIVAALNELSQESPELIILAAAHQQGRNSLYKDFIVKSVLPRHGRELEIDSIRHIEIRYPLNKAVRYEIEEAFIRFGIENSWQLNIDRWTIKSGECWHLQGDNGAGKTSLLKAMAGKVPFHADSKRVELNNRPLHHCLRHDAQVRAIYRGGFISQQRIEDVPELESTLDETLRAAEQGVHAIYAADSSINNRTREWLDLTRLTQYLYQPIKVLSSGQRKRFELVVAIASNAGVLLFDEPFNNLDRASTDLVTEAIELLLADGMAIVVTAHDMPLAMEPVITHRAHIENNSLEISMV